MKRRSFLGVGAAVATAPVLSAREVWLNAHYAGRKPDPLLTVSEWADEYRYLSGVESPEPGRWRTSRTPYLREIQDCLSPSSNVSETIFMKGVQIGATSGPGGNFIGYCIDKAPGVMLVVLPTVDTAKRWSRQKLTHLIEDSPVLRGKVADARERDSGNTMLCKEFTGGMLIITGANSAVGLRSTSAPYMIFDEIDGYPGDVDGEGDPIKLAEKRSQNFSRRKILKISTPTDKGTSRIQREFERGDQRYYFVPCPHCGHFQTFIWKRLEYYPKDKPTGASYRCIKCDEYIEERFKTQMLDRGRWVPTHGDESLIENGIEPERIDAMAIPPEKEVVSYHLSGLYSPLGWFSWTAAAQQWVEAQKDTRLLKVFMNTVLGQTWAERGEAPDWKSISARAEYYDPGVVPMGGMVLLAAVDVQKDRLEYEVTAYGRNRESWSVAYDAIYGDTASDEVWQRLDREVLMRDWPHAAGSTLPIMCMCVDSGYRPEQVYAFALKHPQPSHTPAGSSVVTPRTVVPTKGTDDGYKIVTGVSTANAARKRYGVKIVSVGTHYGKQVVYDRLRLAQPKENEPFPYGYRHHPKAYNDAYFQGLCAENRVIRTVGGKPRVEWIPDPAVRNEPLDLAVYELACAALVGIDRAKESQWLALERQLGIHRPEPVSAPVAIAANTIPAAPAPVPNNYLRSNNGGWLPRRNWFNR